MADFKNPLRTQTGAAFDPSTGPRSKSRENLVNAVIKGGEHVFAKAKTDQVSNVVDTQVADFLAQPDRLRAAGAAQDQLTLETGGDPRHRDYPLIKDLNTNINKLKDAFNAGAIDSTHLLARAKSALRGAIAQNPVLADQLRETVARRLGDYAPDLRIADQELAALTAPDKEASRLEQQKYDHLQKLAEGYGYYLDNKEQLDNFATQFGPVIFKAASLQHQLELSKNGKAISDLEVQKHAPAWVSQKFVETTGKFDQLLRDSSLSDEEKLRRIRATRAAFTAQVDSSLGAHLSSTEISQRMAATNQMFDMYEQAALHEDRRTIAKNMRDSYIYTVASRSLANPDVANLAVATDLFGAFYGNLAAIDKGVRKPLDGIYDVIKDMSTGRTLTPDDVTKAKDEGVFTSVLKTIPERVDAGMWSTDKAQSVMEKFVKSITSPDTSLADPDEQKLMMQGVSIMATPEFRKALEKVDTSTPKMHNFAIRVQQYIGDTVVPWFSRRIDDSFQYHPSPAGSIHARAKTTNLLQVTTPVWGANGKVYLSIEQDRIPSDAWGDPSFLPNLRSRVERFNTSPYVLGWNNAMAASAALSGRTTEEVSKSAWKNVFGGNQ